MRSCTLSSEAWQQLPRSVMTQRYSALLKEAAGWDRDGDVAVGDACLLLLTSACAGAEVRFRAAEAPLRSNRMFCGLMSRCTQPLACSDSSASTTCTCHER